MPVYARSRPQHRRSKIEAILNNAAMASQVDRIAKSRVPASVITPSNLGPANRAIDQVSLETTRPKDTNSNPP
jgi:hypothetical protein